MGFASFEFLESIPNAPGLSNANNDHVRKERIKNKFKFKKFENLDNDGIIIYDDAMKSGTTIDYVSKSFKGHRVIAIVDRIYQTEGANIETFELLPE